MKNQQKKQSKEIIDVFLRYGYNENVDANKKAQPK